MIDRRTQGDLFSLQEEDIEHPGLIPVSNHKVAKGIVGMRLGNSEDFKTSGGDILNDGDCSGEHGAHFRMLCKEYVVWSRG